MPVGGQGMRSAVERGDGEHPEAVLAVGFWFRDVWAVSPQDIVGVAKSEWRLGSASLSMLPARALMASPRCASPAPSWRSPAAWRSESFGSSGAADLQNVQVRAGLHDVGSACSCHHAACRCLPRDRALSAVTGSCLGRWVGVAAPDVRLCPRFAVH